MFVAPQESTSRFKAFIESRRAEATRLSYARGIKSMVGDPDAFLELCDQDKNKAQAYLIARVISKRDSKTLSPATVSSWLAEVKSFTDYYEVPLNWKKIRQVAPPASHVALDRGPTREEIRALVKASTMRARLVALIMSSSAVRIGAFDWLKVGHFSVLGSGVGTLKVYAGEMDAEYTALVTPECVAAIAEYLEARTKFANEKIGPQSPLIRNVWNFVEANGRREFMLSMRPAHANGLRTELFRMWIRSGVRSNEHNRVRRHEFKMAHGFRKFAKTQFSMAGIKWEDSEVLLGHKLNYYKPPLEHLEQEYLKAVPFLTISEAEEKKHELAHVKEEHDSKWTAMRLENLELKSLVSEQGKELASVPELVRKIVADALEAERRDAELRGANRPAPS